MIRTLILGGTVFLGRHAAAEALARGHELTIFGRGRHGTVDGAEHLIGDRTGDLSALEGREWDVVIDTSGYEAQHVARSCAALAPSGADLRVCLELQRLPGVAGRARRRGLAGVGERRRLRRAESGERAGGRGGAAGPRGVGARRPHLRLHMTTSSACRGGCGGSVRAGPAPGDPGRTVQLIDARDLAPWMFDLGERRVTGAFNGTAPPGRTSMGEVLEAAVGATGSGAELAWVPDERLQAAGVEPWTELPLWLPESDFPGTWEIATERAQASGLHCRPIAETIADVWSWLREGGEAELDEWRSEHRPTAMDLRREQELIG